MVVAHRGSLKDGAGELCKVGLRFDSVIPATRCETLHWFYLLERSPNRKEVLYETAHQLCKEPNLKNGRRRRVESITR